MAHPESRSGSAGGTQHQLVCGRCEARLDEVYANRILAQRAAHEHAWEEHPDHDDTIVLTFPVHILEHEPEDAVAVAVEAQEDADERSVGF